MANSHQKTQKPAPRRTTPSTEPYVEISALARKCTTRARFFSEVLRCLTRTFASPYAALHVRFASEVVQDDWHQGSTDPRFWKPGVQQFLTESLAEARSRAKLLLAKTDGTKVAFFSSPIFDPSGPSIGALALVESDVRETELAPRLASLESLCRFASFTAEFVGRSGATPAQAATGDRALARAAGCATAEEFAFAITNELRNKFGFEQVALALAKRNRVRILSVSGLDHVPDRSPGSAALRGAMEECLDVGAPIHFPLEENLAEGVDRAEYFLHKQWSAAAKGDSVASVPLQSGGATLAVLSVRKRAQEPITQELLADIRSKVEPTATALLLLQRSSRGVVRHARESVRDGVAALIAPGRWGRKAAALALAIGLLWFACGTMPYSLTAHACVTPAELRHLTAPFDGVLHEVYVAPGDRVKAGDPLCRMDDRELAQQEASLRAELEVWEYRRNQALSLNSPVDAQLSKANHDLLQARLRAVSDRRERAVVRAPFEGTIVSGDLRTQLGAILVQGHALMSVAPLKAWTLELQVPEADVKELQGTLAGIFRTFARPEQPCQLRISHVWPAAETKEHRNVFMAEAVVEGDAAWLKSGMEGVARIDVGTRRVYWIALHGMVDWLRMKLWL